VTVLYELRVYGAVPGRLPALHARFADYTLRLFSRHGITPVGFWTTYIGPSSAQLTYLLRWESLADREQRWEAFMSDPEWIEVRAGSERNGPLVTRVENSILEPTVYSPMT
jgi:hypothetical protein